MKILAFGNIRNYKYHPFKPIIPYLKSLSKSFNFVFAEEIKEITYDNLKNYDIFLSYADLWDEKISLMTVNEIEKFIKSGKGYVVIHSGISLNNIRHYKLIGAEFKMHPEYQKILYKITNKKHPIVEGLSEFILEDELYIFKFHSKKMSILVKGEYNNNLYPAIWTRCYFRGRIVYLSPGHTENSFKNKVYSEILKRSILWAGKKL